MPATPELAAVLRRLLGTMIVIGFVAAIAACDTGTARFAEAKADFVPAEGSPLSIRPITHGSVVIEHGADVIFVDPVAPARLYAGFPKPTLILVTHAHEDHFDPKTIGALATTNTNIVVSRDVGTRRGMTTITMQNGEAQALGNVRVEAVAMHNTASSFHLKGDGNGYVVTIGGKRLYFAGDTECVAESRALEHIDVAFLPMNLPFTMSPHDAAECAKRFRPSVVYPYHYRGQDPSIFANELTGSGIEVRLRDWY